MVDRILKKETTSFAKLSKVINKGTILKNCNFQFLEKVNNLKYNNSVVYIGSNPGLTLLNDQRISGIITTKEIANNLSEIKEIGIWVYENPEELFFLLHEYLVEKNFYFSQWEKKISPKANISPRASIAQHSVTIEKDCIIEGNVVIKPFTIIKKGSIVRSSSDIGSDGFEAHLINGKRKIMKHGGLVIIGENVEIQSLVTISRGLFPSRNTTIGDNVKIADLVHVAHGVSIGDNTMIAAGVTVSGNTSIGENVFIGPGAVISNRLNIGDDSFISIGSVVVRNVQLNQKVSGNFAIEHNKMLKHIIKNDLV